MKVPQGWKIYHLGELFTSRKEKGYDGLPTFSVTINDGLIDRSTLERKMETNLEADQHLLVKKGDISYNMMRMWQGALGLAYFDGIVSPAYVVLAPTKLVDSKFAFLWFKLSRMIYLFWAYSYGLTEDRLRLYYNDFIKIKNFLPPLPEQKAIADILTTWDEAIEKYEKLIAAKEKRFQWLLHELIGKHQKDKPRIDTNVVVSPSNHKHEWRMVKLGDVCDVTMGSSPPSVAYNDMGNGLPLLQGKADLKVRKSAPRLYTSIITKTCCTGDLLISVRAPVGYISKACHHCCIGRGIAALGIKKDFSTDYIFFLLVSIENKLTSVSQGGTFEAISGDEISKIKIKCPSIETQKKIADTLSAAQHEIDILKQLSEKYKLQKRGLMQKLLTGKWRVNAHVVKMYEE